MSSLMVHLLAAKKYKTDPSVLFCVGNVAPDCVQEWKAKDRTHLRDREDREEALAALARSTDMSNDFLHGNILHLYLDWIWDRDFLVPYKKNYTGENWFIDYRNEISKASSWLFHHKTWSADVWNSMLECPAEQYDLNPMFPCEDILGMMTRNGKWHRDNILEASQAFPPDTVEAFTDEIASGFPKWIRQI